jgi:hypothetical protein
MGASPKGIVTLTDGTAVTVDVSTLKVREWRSLWNPATPVEEEDKIVSRLTGLDSEALEEMARDDFRRLFEKIIELSNRPLDDPKNSQSAST